MTKTLVRIFELFCLLVLVTNVAFAEWHSIGGLKAEKPEANQFTFSSPRATLGITVLAPGLVRVRLAAGTSTPPDHSYPVIQSDRQSVAAEFSDEKNMHIIRTSDLQGHVHLSPFRAAFYDQKSV